MDEEVYTVEDIFERDTPLSEGILGLSEGPTLSPITDAAKIYGRKRIKKTKRKCRRNFR